MSDGSAPHTKGSFAWIISNTQGTRLVRCSGPVYGYKITLYHAESYGVLSILHFLHIMATIHSDPQQQTLHSHFLYCDNEGLVTTISTMQKFAYVFPNIKVTPEWDCIAQILHTLQQLNHSKPTLLHIMGHQDEKTPYKELDLSAQLNCDADFLASQYLTDNPDINHTHATLFPQAECALHLPVGTITRDHKQELRNTRNDRQLKAKLLVANGWDSQTHDSVDWQAHAQALKRHRLHHTTFVKYLHNILPIGKRTHRYNLKYPPSCPSCHEPKEDINHFWTCLAPHRVAGRKDFLTNLEKCLINLNTKKPVRILLLSKLKSFFDGNQAVTIVDPTIAAISNAQDQIGWDQVLKGRFSNTWNKQSTLPSQRLKHKSWTVEVIDCIFTQWLEMWELRNKDRHGQDRLTQQQASTMQAHRELQLMYERYQAAAPETLQWLFNIDLPTRRQWSNNKLWQWIHTWQPVLEDKTRPHWAPSHPENYPYQTQLETG